VIAKGFIALVKSTSIDHIEENWRAMEFSMDQNDLELLDMFREPGYQSPEYDYWASRDDKVKIWKL
jgi:diketogulonate reductase-like aldo/keto reductase